MKTNGIVVVAVQDKKGDFWQVALNKEQMEVVMDLLVILGDGQVRCLPNRLDGLVLAIKPKND